MYRKVHTLYIYTNVHEQRQTCQDSAEHIHILEYLTQIPTVRGTDCPRC